MKGNSNHWAIRRGLMGQEIKRGGPLPSLPKGDVIDYSNFQTKLMNEAVSNGKVGIEQGALMRKLMSAVGNRLISYGGIIEQSKQVIEYLGVLKESFRELDLRKQMSPQEILTSPRVQNNIVRLEKILEEYNSRENATRNGRRSEQLEESEKQLKELVEKQLERWRNLLSSAEKTIETEKRKKFAPIRKDYLGRISSRQVFLSKGFRSKRITPEKIIAEAKRAAESEVRLSREAQNGLRKEMYLEGFAKWSRFLQGFEKLKARNSQKK